MRRFLLSIALIIFLVLVFWGVVRLDQPGMPPLRVGTNVWPGYEPLYLARSMGLYRDQDIHLVELHSATDVLHLFRNGELDAAALTLDEALTLLQDQYDLRVILVMDVSAGGDMLLARSGISALPQLRGKTIAVEHTGVGAILLDGALAAAGLTLNDINLQRLTVDQHRQAFLQGQVDAVVTFDPVATYLMQEGARKLFDSSRIPGRIVDVLVVRKEVIEPYQAVLEKLLHGYFQAVQFLKASPQEAVSRMQGRLVLSEKAILQSYQGMKLPSLQENRYYLTGAPSPLQTRARELADLMLKNELLDRPVRFSQLTEPRFLPRKIP